MRFIKLTLEYDGTPFSGWQSQKNGVAIQDVAAAAVTKMTGEEIILRGASRTDAGVHALGQVAVFKTARNISCGSFLRGLNTLLPPEIRVTTCGEVAEHFHPIRSTKRKHYDYFLEVGGIPSPFWRNRAWWIGEKIDWEAIRKATTFLTGEHDFTSFRGSLSETKTAVRRLDTISIEHKFQNIFCVRFTGNGFLKYMVRNIIGTLVAVGQGRRRPAEVSRILAARDRRLAGKTAPPQGLYLVEVEY